MSEPAGNDQSTPSSQNGAGGLTERVDDQYPRRCVCRAAIRESSTVEGRWADRAGHLSHVVVGADNRGPQPHVPDGPSLTEVFAAVADQPELPEPPDAHQVERDAARALAETVTRALARYPAETVMAMLDAQAEHARAQADAARLVAYGWDRRESEFYRAARQVGLSQLQSTREQLTGSGDNE